MKRVIAYGGSFNPPHYGHLKAAEAISRQLDTKVTFIPCAPHKRGEYASFADRAEMVRLAIEGSPYFDLSLIEKGIEGHPSYTLDSVLALKEQGFDEVYWVIGADNIERSARWRNFERLKDECTFIVTPRPHYGVDPKRLSDRRHVLIDVPAIDVSSTVIRDRIKMGLPLDGLTPSTVIEYLRSRKLYQPQG